MVSSEKTKENKSNLSNNIVNNNVSPNEDETRSWDDINQLDRGNDKEKLADSNDKADNSSEVPTDNQ